LAQLLHLRRLCKRWSSFNYVSKESNDRPDNKMVPLRHERSGHVSNNNTHLFSLPALTLTQPWATLVACGAKRIETRSWTTSWRGWLAIHAAKAFPPEARRFAEAPLVQATLIATGYMRPPEGSSKNQPLQVPCGQVIAIALLNSIVRLPSAAHAITEQERAFGNYADGRYAWIFSEVHPLPVPLPARGSLGLWQWDVPVALRSWLAPHIGKG
jgi:hypothetical protein